MSLYTINNLLFFADRLPNPSYLLALSLYFYHQFHPLRHPSWALHPLDQFENQTQPTINIVPVSPYTNAPHKKLLPFPSCYPDSDDKLQQPSSSSRRDVRPLFLQPKHMRSQSEADIVTLHWQHNREYFASRARAIKRPSFYRRLQYELKPGFSFWKRNIGIAHDKSLFWRMSHCTVNKF